MGEFAVSDWLTEHQPLVEYLDIINGRHSYRHPAFSAKRAAVWNRMVSRLLELETQLHAVVDTLTSTSAQIAAEPIQAQSIPLYDDPRRNLAVRSLSFARHHVYRLRLSVVSRSFDQVTRHLQQTGAFIDFFRKVAKFLPDDSIIRIKEPFFAVETEPPPQSQFRIAALRHWIERREADCAAFDTPPWIADFRGFFRGLIEAGVHGMDRALSYAVPLPHEVNLSRAIFCDANNRQVMEEIDDMIAVGLSGRAHDFVSRAIEYSLRSIPDSEALGGPEQSVGVLMFFRVIFDRFYETLHRSGTAPNFDRQKILWQVARLPMKVFYCPIEIKGQTDCEVPIRDWYLRNHRFRGASLFLDEAALATNPIDALYLVHRALLAMRSASVMRIKRTEPLTSDDLKTLLCFDDLFSLLVGVLLASELPDLFSFVQFVETFAPYKSLVNQFEFAKAALTALKLHFEAIDMDVMRKRAQDDHDACAARPGS
jgi:hypothetical protein